MQNGKGSVERLKQLKHIATENIRSWMRERKFAEWMALPPLQIHIRHRKMSCDKVNDMGLTVVATAYCPSQSPDDERNWCSLLLFEWNLNNEGTQAKIIAGKDVVLLDHQEKEITCFLEPLSFITPSLWYSDTILGYNIILSFQMLNVKGGCEALYNADQGQRSCQSFPSASSSFT